MATLTQDRSFPSHGPSFHEIALKHGTDKVTDHQYHYMYDKYLPAIRNEKIKMLEIGLGCDMVSIPSLTAVSSFYMWLATCAYLSPTLKGYGPGASYYTWLEYFPNVDLYFIEYNAECAEKWADQTAGATIFPGDQADKAFLRKFIEETGGDFDVIIDDGGHSMVQQETSLELLWKVVKPGGVYFVEDLQTSFMTVSGYGGDPTGGKDPNVHTMLKFIYELIDDRMTPDGTRHAISADMQSIDCMREVCAFFKKTS